LEDTCAPEAPALASQMNEWERRRDPSHRENRPPSRLRQMLQAAGLRVEADALGLVQQTFGDWAQRAGVPQPEAGALRDRFLGASPGARPASRSRLEEHAPLRLPWNATEIVAIRRS